MDKYIKAKIKTEYIINYIEENGLTKKQFADKCECSLRMLNNILKKKKCNSYIDIFAISNVINIPCCVLLGWEVVK